VHWIRHASLVEWVPDDDPAEVAEAVVDLFHDLAGLPRLPKNKVLYGSVPSLLATALKVAVDNINAARSDSTRRWAVKVIRALVRCAERHTWLQTALEIEGPLQEQLIEAMDVAARRAAMYRGGGAGVRALCSAQRLTAIAHEDFWMRLGRWERDYGGNTVVDILRTYEALVAGGGITAEEHGQLWPGVERAVSGSSARMSLTQLVAALDALRKIAGSVGGVDVPRQMIDGALAALAADGHESGSQGGENGGRSAEARERGGAKGATLQVLEALRAFGVGYSDAVDAAVRAYFDRESRPGRAQRFGTPVLHMLARMHANVSSEATCAIEAHVRDAAERCKLPPGVGAQLLTDLPALGANPEGLIPLVLASAAAALVDDLRLWSLESAGPDTDLGTLQRTIVCRIAPGVGIPVAEVEGEEANSTEGQGDGFEWLEAELRKSVAAVRDCQGAVEALEKYADALKAEWTVRQHEYPASVFAAVEDGDRGGGFEHR
jgi:hypothetical protein